MTQDLLGAMFGAGRVETFLGLPAAAPDRLGGARVAILGADGATPYPVGFYCAGGPAAIRAGSAGFSASHDHVNFDLGGPLVPPGAGIADCGDLSVDVSDAAANRARIGAAVAQVLEQGAVPLLLGGDDSVQIPMLAELAARGPLTVLQIDAHIDWRDTVGGERWGLSSTMRRASEMPGVERIVQVGARGVGSARAGELADALAWGVGFFPARDIVGRDLAPVLDAVPDGARVVVCLDLDALDPAVMPAVIGRTPGGLSYQAVLALLAGVAAKARIAGMGMVEFMPARDIDGQGATCAAGLAMAALGLIAGQAADARGPGPG